MPKYPSYKLAPGDLKPREVSKIPEAPPTREGGIEIGPEKVKPEEKIQEAVVPVAPKVEPTPAAAPPKEPVLQEIEYVLSAGLLDVYKQLPSQKQTAFKEEGERVAAKIRQMIAGAHIKVREILKMIRKWLGMIPGINRFFLEQEAKIKTDKILEIAKQKKE